MLGGAVVGSVACRLASALRDGASALRSGANVSCSLALLPSVALPGMPESWGTADLTPRDARLELVVGVGREELAAALSAHVAVQCGVTGGAPLIGRVASHLGAEVSAVALLLMPSNDLLWNYRRCWLSSVDDVDVWVVELLFTSLLLSCHYKRPEIWVHRFWVVQYLLTHDALESSVFHVHDRAVLTTAADKHPMNYNAWHYRRNVLSLSCMKLNLIMEGEMDFALRFFELHNCDASSATFLVFLLERAGSVAGFWWRILFASTCRELRRHYDKGHESVWMLRLALVRWALKERPLCGWTLHDELQYATHFTTLSGENGSGEIGVLNWVDINGSQWWTGYHATRYVAQLLCLLRDG